MTNVQTQPARAPSEREEGPNAEIAARFANGEIATMLGLTTEELNVGLTIARNHLLRGTPQEAMKIYFGLVLCQPFNIDYQIGLANCAGAMGEHNLAIQAASAVIALAPSNPRGYLLSGRNCLAIGCAAEAREDLSDAVRLAEAAKDGIALAEAKRLLASLSAA